MVRKSHGLLSALVLASISVPVLAGPTADAGTSQADGAFRDNGRGGGGPRDWGHRGPRSSKFEISRWLGGVQQLESGKSALSKAQAKQVVGIVGPWRTKKTMTEADAKTVSGRLASVLTPTQREQVMSFHGNRFRRPDGGGGRPGGFGGPPGGRPDGPPPGTFGGDRRGPRPNGMGAGQDGRPRPIGGERPNFEDMRTYMATFNPLASPKVNPSFSKLPDFMQEMLVRRFRESDAMLVKLAKKAK
jgi:hypothetical protein